ncbi:SDR family NAD(P)-dependent oxidoreductase [Streptomyces sp. HC307]|uniref:SDR family NAD(P)-dependent oxidoreductase n=1 Tax=Streptomyces flavusporus TaxID=3385496 RepID=UPI0039174894
MTAHSLRRRLINNAGIMLPENLLDPASLPVAEDHVTVNLLGTIRMTFAFLPLLVDKADAVVINVSSGLAFAPLPATPTYSATKAAAHCTAAPAAVRGSYAPGCAGLLDCDSWPERFRRGGGRLLAASTPTAQPPSRPQVGSFFG